MRFAAAVATALLIIGLGPGCMLADTQPAVPPLESIHMIDALVGWAKTAQFGRNTFVRTADGGAHWRTVTPLDSSGRTRAVAEVAVLNSFVAWVELSEGTFAPILGIFHTVDGGKVWRRAPIPILGTIDFVDERHGWLMSGVGAAGSEEVDIYRSTDGGDTWTKTASARYNDERSGLPFGGNKTAITFRDAATGWVTGGGPGNDRLVLYMTRDGGHRWHRQQVTTPPGVAPHWNAVVRPPHFFAERDGVLPVSYAVRNESYEDIGAVVAFYLTHDGGMTWAPTTPLSVILGKRLAVSVADAAHGWVTDGTVFNMTSDGGRHWTRIEPQPSLAGVKQLDFISSRVGWAVRSASPTLLKTMDGGRTWTPIYYTIVR